MLLNWDEMLSWGRKGYGQDNERLPTQVEGKMWGMQQGTTLLSLNAVKGKLEFLGRSSANNPLSFHSDFSLLIDNYPGTSSLEYLA